MYRYRMNRYACVIVVFAASVLVGCSQHTEPPATTPGSEHAHAHTAPHGGHLIALGDHAANLEIVLDNTTGSMDLYVLDGHAEGSVRLSVPTLNFDVKPVGAESIAVTLHAVENPLTGETVGDTSHFSARAVPQLVGLTDIDLTIPVIEVGGVGYADVAAHLHP